MQVDVSALNDQFLISRERTIDSKNWRVEEHGGWRISHHESLPLVPIRLGDGTRIGTFLGPLISDEGRLLTGECRAPFASAAEIEEDALEAFVFAFGGRFACLLDFDDTRRLYVDACASLAAVYSLDRLEAASTTTVLGSSAGYGKSGLGPGMEQFPGRNEYFPAGLTGDPRVRRLLPGHYLDLAGGGAVRHWPRPDFQPDDAAAIPRHIDRIVGAMTAHVAAILRERDAYVSLTAGMDSRMLLACSREHRDRIQFFTFNWGPKADADMDGARYLARRLGLDHRRVQCGMTDAEIAAAGEEWNHRTGFCGAEGKAAYFLGASRRELDLRRAWIIAYGGEIGRAILIKPHDRPDDRSAPKDFLRRLHLPRSKVFVDAMAEWLRGIEWANHLLQLELALLEHLWACRANAQIYGFAPFASVTSPFSHRAIVEGMLRLPVDYRRAKGVTTAVARSAWPEIAGYPFERAGGPRGLLAHALRLGLGDAAARRLVGTGPS